MWIEKIENSRGIRYKYNERFADPATGKAVKVSITMNSGARRYHRQALEMLESKFNDKYIMKMKAAANQRAAMLESLTFEQVAAEWLDSIGRRIKPSTVVVYRNAVKAIMDYLPAGVCFMNVSPAMIEKVINTIYYEEKKSHGYTVILLTRIKQIFKYARKANYIDDISAFEKIKPDKRPATQKELSKAADKFLNRGELRDCLDQLQRINQRIGLMMEFIALTGLRIGELLALRVKDYNKEKSCININGTIYNGVPNGTDGKRGTPKTASSYRNVDLSNRARQILDWFILENKKSAQWNRARYVDRGYIFTSGYGFPYHHGQISRALNKVQIEGKNITTHIFRHTHISLLAEMGEPLKVIMARVGHSNANTTLRIYTHVTDKMKADLVNKLNALGL